MKPQPHIHTDLTYLAKHEKLYQTRLALHQRHTSTNGG